MSSRGCCSLATHSVIRRCPSLWAQARRLGVKAGMDWRNCPLCDSTLVKLVDADEPAYPSITAALEAVTQ